MKFVLPAQDIPVSVISEPGAEIYTSVHVHGTRPFKVTILADKAVEGIKEFEQVMGITRENREAEATHQRVCGTVVAAVQQPLTNESASGAAVAALWATLHHPKEAQSLRRSLWTHLKSNKKAHLTFSTFEGGAVTFAVTMDEVPAETMEAAITDADRLTEEGLAETMKKAN